MTGINAGQLDDIKSIKSLDITGKRYRSPYTLEKTLEKYIQELADFKTTRYKNITWHVKEGSSRTLEIAIPPVEMTAKQAEIFKKMEGKAAEKKVDLIVTIVS